jgi:hypothetical protein
LHGIANHENNLSPCFFGENSGTKEPVSLWKYPCYIAMLFVLPGTCGHLCAAYHYSQIMELELKKLEETIKNIHEEMFYLRER